MAGATSFVVRLYEPADLDQTVDLWYRSWTEAFPDLKHPQPFETWKHRFERELTRKGTIWVVEQDAQIMGFMLLVLQEGYIDQMFVHPDFQRRGVGDAMMKLAKCTSPAGLRLHTLQQNNAARAFYEKHGFVAGAKGVNSVNGWPNIEYHWRPATPR